MSAYWVERKGDIRYLMCEQGAARCLQRLRPHLSRNFADDLQAVTTKARSSNFAYTNGQAAVNDLIRREREWSAMPREEIETMRARNLPDGWTE